MNFFCKKKHYDQWVEAGNINKENIFCLNAHDGLTVAEMIFNVDD